MFKKEDWEHLAVTLYQSFYDAALSQGQMSSILLSLESELEKRYPKFPRNLFHSAIIQKAVSLNLKGSKSITTSGK